MKKFLRSWLINSVSLACLAWFFSGLILSFSPDQFFLTTLILTLLSKIITPLFDLILLPIHVITLGLFRWLKTALVFLIVNYLAPGLNFQQFDFPGISWQALEIKPFHTSWLLALVMAAFLFNLIKKVIQWVLKRS